MIFETWIAFTLASTMLLIIPGPTVLLVISYALGHGKHTAWATVPGVTVGDFIAMTISLLGAGAILATSATLFSILKLVGGAYLIWLGVSMWRAKTNKSKLSETENAISPAKMFWHSCIVTALNPKSIVFFVAFLPLFIDPKAPLLLQFAVMEATFLSLAAINVAIWAVFAGNMRGRFAKPETMRKLNRIGGAILISTGVFSALVKRS